MTNIFSNFTFIVLSTLIFSKSVAQNKVINLRVGLRYNVPEILFNGNHTGYDEKRGGYGFELTPKWNFSDKHSLGLDLGINLITEDATTDAIGHFAIVSYLPTFEHKLFDANFSPFYSVGIGGYTEVNGYTSTAVGLSASLGMLILHRLVLSVKYNKIFSKLYTENVKGFDNWYFVGIKLGYDIGIK